MEIPKNLKIGGKVYTVDITDNLTLGSANCTGEIIYDDLIIRIRPAAKARMESTFIHEMIHGIFDHLGYCEQDEKSVDELANALYAVIVDNPELLTKSADK